MPYYGTMEMSLHCCGASAVGGRRSVGARRLSRAFHGLKGRPSELIYGEDLWLLVFK